MNQEQETTGPGIVVLSSSLQVLHMNRRAMALLTQLEHTGQSIGTEWAVTAPLHQHCQDIIETLQARLGSNNWEQFQQYRTIGDSTHTILLKGFGLPDQRGLPHSRIVMLLSPHTPAVDAGNQQKGVPAIIARIPPEQSHGVWPIACRSIHSGCLAVASMKIVPFLRDTIQRHSCRKHRRLVNLTSCW